jgi:hypothetical protein
MKHFNDAGGRDFVVKQGHLRGRHAEGGGGEVREVVGEAGLSAGDGEEGLDLFGEDAFALHPNAPPGIVQFAAPHRLDAAEDLVLVAGSVAIEPLGEERCDGVRRGMV